MTETPLLDEMRKQMEELSAEVDLTPIEKIAFLVLQSGAFALSNGHIDAYRLAIISCGEMLKQFEPEHFEKVDKEAEKISNREEKINFIVLNYLKGIAKVLSKKSIQIKVKLTEEDMKKMLRNIKVKTDGQEIEIQ